MSSEDIIKCYHVDKDRYLEVTKDELENIALESTAPSKSMNLCPAARSTISISCALITLCLTARSRHDAFAVIRKTIQSLDKVALARCADQSRARDRAGGA